MEAALDDEPPAVHLLTNSRALDESAAYALVREASEAAEAAAPEPRLVLRGDSTLRAHLLPEYAGVRDALYPGTAPPLLLVPALPAAGRVTRDGHHWLVRGGKRVPLEETEFATDGEFAYESSRLLDWAQERSDGYFPAARGIEIDLDRVRSDDGAEAVAAALLEAALGQDPAVVVPDAETEADLETIAEGLRRAWLEAPAIVVRCAPTFASVLSGAGATARVPLPVVERGLLVVVGSHVPISSAQLAALETRHPGTTVELDPAVLAGAGAGEEIARAAERARALLDRGRLAIVATARSVSPEALGPTAGMRVARAWPPSSTGCATPPTSCSRRAGSTSAINVRDGLHAERAQIVGPVAPGISLWLVNEDAGEAQRPVIVFPGNVGEAETLADLVDRLLEG